MKTINKRRAALVLLAALAGWTAPARAAESEGLTIGLIASSTAEQVVAEWQPLADALARELKQPVQLYASKNYNEVAEALKAGRIQVAWLNNQQSIELVEKDIANVFAQGVRLDGSLGYKSLLLVRADSPLKSLADLLAKPGAYTLSMGGKTSVSGYLAPAYYAFAKGRVDPEKSFKRVSYGRSHHENFLALTDGKAELVTNNTEEVPRYEAEFAERWKKVRVLWESPLIPNDPLVMRKDVAQDTQQRVRRFFTSYGRTESEKATLKAINGLSGYRASSNYQLRPVVDLELFDRLTKAMALQSQDPAGFQVTMDQLTQRAGRLEAVLSASRLTLGR